MIARQEEQTAAATSPSKMMNNDFSKPNRGTADEYMGVEIPSRFICPLTLELMTDPMMTRSGHNFERSAIITWLEQSDKSPLTREPLHLRNLVRNRSLQLEIRVWKYKVERQQQLQSKDGDAEDKDETTSRATDDLDSIIDYDYPTMEDVNSSEFEGGDLRFVLFVPGDQEFAINPPSGAADNAAAGQEATANTEPSSRTPRNRGLRRFFQRPGRVTV